MIRTRFGWILFAMVISVNCSAFEIKTISEISPEAFLKWNTSDGPVTVALDAKGSADVPIKSVETALIHALGAWQDVTNQSIRLQFAGSIQIAEVQGGDHVNSVSWKEHGWNYSSFAAAVTIYSYYLDDPPEMVDADILMNGEDYRWSVQSVTEGKTLNVEQVLLHELGHALGLAHTSEQRAVMFPYIASQVSTKLALDDRAGLRFLYGDSATTLRLITPVRRALYVEGMAESGLPLPVLRWGPGVVPDYVIQFSDTSSFGRRIQIHVGSQRFYQLTAADERKLLKLSSIQKVYWRVLSGGEQSNRRVLRFAPETR